MKKSHKAGILSAVIWGLGQIYNRQFIKGIIFFCIQVILLINLNSIAYHLWGFVTLGETAMIIEGGKVIHGDNSILLMIEGIITILVLILFAVVYIINIKDALHFGEMRDEGKKIPTAFESISEVWDKWFPYIMLTPSTIFIMFLVILPILFGFFIAFTNYCAPHHLPPRHLVDWVGFKNFKNIFKIPMWNSTFWGVASWTLIWAFVSTFTCFFGGLFMAVLINSRRVKYKKLWRTIYILPWAIPSMISLLVFRNLFNGQFGPVNRFLRDYGFIQKNIPWLSDPNLAKVTIIIINLWLGFPYFMALMSGVMTSISPELYEAARIDGATSRQEFWHITFPLVLYATAPLLVMSFAGNFNNFNVIYFLTEGNPINPKYKFAGSTDILITWIYKLTKDNKQFHMASVMSIIIYIMIGSISAYNFTKTKAFKEEDMIV